MLVTQMTFNDTGQLPSASTLRLPFASSDMFTFLILQEFGGILHDLAISNDGKAAYIAQLNPPKIWKFMISIQGL